MSINGRGASKNVGGASKNIGYQIKMSIKKNYVSLKNLIF